MPSLLSSKKSAEPHGQRILRGLDVQADAATYRETAGPAKAFWLLGGAVVLSIYASCISMAERAGEIPSEIQVTTQAVSMPMTWTRAHGRAHSTSHDNSQTVQVGNSATVAVLDGLYKEATLAQATLLTSAQREPEKIGPIVRIHRGQGSAPIRLLAVHQWQAEALADTDIGLLIALVAHNKRSPPEAVTSSRVESPFCSPPARLENHTRCRLR